MKKSKELLLIRYISFIILISEIFIKGKNSGIFSIIFILLFIINNNLRIFFFKSDKVNLFSIILEMIVSPIACFYFGGNIIFYLIGLIIDTVSLNYRYLKNMFLSTICLIAIYSEFKEGFEQGFINLVIIVVFATLINYISKLYNTKKEAQRLYDKLRISEESLIEANSKLEECLSSIEELTILKERNRISREIHDSVGHTLSTSIIQLSAMEALATEKDSLLKDMIIGLRSFISENFQDVKEAVKELKADDYGNYKGIIRIQDLCKNFEKMTGVEVNTIISKGSWALSTKQITHLYRITQEVLSNSLKHGKATKIKVIMNFTEDDFVISFKDNGIGVSYIKNSGFGLKNLRERVDELQGFIDMTSKLGEGFFVKIVLPKEREI
ncbi:sensor histidine kinase [uncultured Clostridium sp.]|uniref:sensor histidine kinase n=1 Tax=uncultured Clostridium sp. TaxID=59620 RepID=UPI00258F42B8|nr:sensor histidine kinase [uncultured Clostridium sp.]